MPHHRANFMAKRFAGAALALAALLGGCSADQLTVPNYNNPTPASIAADPAAIQYAVNGILGQNRANYSAYISDVGIFGRESYNYFPTDARFVSHYLIQNPL